MACQYFKKYPPEFERFKPTCQSVELQNCSTEELRAGWSASVHCSNTKLGSGDFKVGSTRKSKDGSAWVHEQIPACAPILSVELHEFTAQGGKSATNLVVGGPVDVAADDELFFVDARRN